jgi:gamma-glutamyl-gamma-aminobutyrate hydrolase PuuD
MMPEKILVVNGMSYGRAVEDLGILTGNISEFAKHPSRFKLVLLTGGEDVDPSFYGETSPHYRCHSTLKRDEFEKIVFEYAVQHGIKIAGICRGLQFINVMAGGKLVHHLDGHGGVYHKFECLKDNEIRLVNSIHHQMAMPSEEGITIGWSPTKLSKNYIGDRDEVTDWAGPEVESAIYPKFNACGVQWHPEMMPKEHGGYIFFRDMVDALLQLDMDDFVNLYTGNTKKAEEKHKERKNKK